MDGSRFDDLARAFAGASSRRRFLGGFAAGAVGLIGRRTAEGASCREVGTVCTSNGNCCSQLCGAPDKTARRRCECSAGFATCNGDCVDPATAYASDPANCGACGHVCPRTRCQVATCSSGVCGLAPDVTSVGKSCDGGNLCTTGNACQSDGSCSGTPITCTAVDQCHTAGVCNPATGTCSNPAKTNGASCNDGNACTQSDTCQNGVCTGGNPVVCTATDQCHATGTCDPATGTCSNPLKPNGSACNDGNACTQTDTCQAGVCTGGNPVVCAASDQCHTAGVCNSVTGQCSNPAKTDGVSCNADNNACTVDTCQAGICTAGAPKDCSTDPAYNDQCHIGVCNTTTGQCEKQAKPNGSACDDGNACTQTDTCQAGVCTGGNPVVCTASDQCHLTGVCNPATGVCTNPVKSDGTACSDNNACTNTDTCQAGACVPGTSVVCAPAGPCQQTGICNHATGQCEYANKSDGIACSGSNHCINYICSAGACIEGTSVVCNDFNACTTDTCDPATGCVYTVINCDDHNACTTDTCDPTTGCHHTQISCNDNNACTIDTCDPVSGCVHTPINCDDDNPCTTDTCDPVTGCVHTPKVCAAPDQCHQAGVCDPSTGDCTFAPKTNGSACDTGNACTVNDTCQNGVCTAGTLVSCTALDQCHTAGTCDPGTGTCTNPPKSNGTACNDGNACTQSDTCQSGVCTGANPVVCAAQDQCHTAGTCDPATGICSNPAKANGTACNDGNACTQTDTCQSGTCVGGNPVVCTASDQCHSAGTCDPATGVCSNPAKANGTACNDGNACTQTDTCQSGTCVGSNPVVCTAIDQCHTAGTCNPATGICSNPPKSNGTPCDDGNPCTSGDTCQSGTCSPGTTITCSVANGTGACNPSTGTCEITSCNAGFSDCDFTYATGCDTNTNTSVNHCGACFHSCPTDPHGVTSCVNGTCNLTCNSGYTDCNGHCCPAGHTCCSDGANHGCCVGSCCSGTCCEFASPISCCKSGICYSGADYCP